MACIYCDRTLLFTGDRVLDTRRLAWGFSSRDSTRTKLVFRRGFLLRDDLWRNRKKKILLELSSLSEIIVWHKGINILYLIPLCSSVLNPHPASYGIGCSNHKALYHKETNQ